MQPYTPSPSHTQYTEPTVLYTNSHQAQTYPQTQGQPYTQTQPQAQTQAQAQYQAQAQAQVQYNSATKPQPRLPLMRPLQGRWFAGVCQGIALHLGLSVAIVRILTVLLCVVYGAGAIAYLLLWIFIPSGDPYAQAQAIAYDQQTRMRAPLASSLRTTSSTPFDTSAPFASPTRRRAQATTPTQTNSGIFFGQESLLDMLHRLPLASQLATTGITLLTLSILLASRSVTWWTIVPLIIAILGIVIAWMHTAALHALPHMIIGICCIILAWMLYIWQLFGHMSYHAHEPHTVISGLVMLLCIVIAVLPWINTTFQQIVHERALQEREAERADMTAHLHDGVLQTLALIQLHAEDRNTVFTLAHSQERQLRQWLYQDHPTAAHSIHAGLQEITATIEDTHGQPIELICVGDTEPSMQTEALLAASQQALINAVTHGKPPFSVYCEVHKQLVEVFVRDHGDGFDPDAIDPDRLGIRKSIIERIERRGGHVEIVSRSQWGTEVRMHMPIHSEN